MNIINNANMIYSVDNEWVNESLRYLESIHVTFGVINSVDKEFVPILENGEKFQKRGLYLHIETYRCRITASVRMQALAGINERIRWINHLYFTTPENPEPISVKSYIAERHNVQWAS